MDSQHTSVYVLSLDLKISFSFPCQSLIGDPYSLFYFQSQESPNFSKFGGKIFQSRTTVQTSSNGTMTTSTNNIGTSAIDRYPLQEYQDSNNTTERNSSDHDPVEYRDKDHQELKSTKLNGDAKHGEASTPKTLGSQAEVSSKDIETGPKHSIWQKIRVVVTHTPPRCRYEPESPKKFSMWLNVLFCK